MSPTPARRHETRPRGPSIRWLLLGANLVVVCLPLFAVVALRLYDVALLRQTERQLIAESVVLGEAYRDAYGRAGGVPSDGGAARAVEARPDAYPASLSSAPAARRVVEPDEGRYTPIEPVIDIGSPVLPAVLDTRAGASRDPIAVRAGQEIEPLMRRAQTFNLSGVRLLDGRGCVVATTRSQDGRCLDSWPEVKSALAGRYAATARERISDEPLPALGSIRRRGRVRVFTALPVLHRGRVIGVVAASRTGLDALSSLWQSRRDIVLVALFVLAVAVVAALSFAWTIARPLRALTHAARAIIAGRDAPAAPMRGFVPSEIAILDDAFREMTARLRARADDAAERAADASHELKTPLAAIRGAIELLRDGDDMPDAQRRRFIANIDADAERMERLVTGMLSLARVESEASQAADTVDPEPVLRAALARYADVSLTVERPLASIAIRVDHLESVVLNLVDNARRHGAGKPVSVRAASRASRLVLEVEDHGSGIREANRARVFDRFFTTERDRGGTGLGLALVRAVAEARGGEVTFETSEAGTTFRVVL